MSLRRLTVPIALFLLLALLAACSGAEEVTEQPRPSVTSTSTTSTIPTTTTTVEALTIDGAGEGLTSVVEQFYAYAVSESTEAPPMPEPLLESIVPAGAKTPTHGSASIGTFAEQRVGVVSMANDVFLFVNAGKGWRIVGGEWPSVSVPAYFGPAPRIVAVVGSDARPNEAMDRTRADSIHFVGLDGTGGGGIVGLPRDSYVPVPGHGTKKVNSALALEGPETMMETFDDLTGLPLEGYVLTGFAGFTELAGSVLGGVEVEVPFSINDKWAKASLSAGQQLLDGAQALGFARARKTVGGDFVRSGHQGMILLGAAKMVQDMGYAAIPGLLELSEPHMMTNLTPEQLLTFSAMAIWSDLDAIPNVVAPGRSGSAGGASVVFLSGSVNDLWADLADGNLVGE